MYLNYTLVVLIVIGLCAVNKTESILLFVIGCGYTPEIIFYLQGKINCSTITKNNTNNLLNNQIFKLSRGRKRQTTNSFKSKKNNEKSFRFHAMQHSFMTGGDSSKKGCFGRKTNLFQESGDFAGNRETWEIFREIWDIFGTLSKDLILHVIKQYIYSDMHPCSVCSVFYVFWHLKTAELPMIWKDQSATFPTKIAWSSSAIDHVESPADGQKNRTGARVGARHILSVHTRFHHSLVQGYFYAAC